MKKSKFLAAALAATMFTTAACGLVACGDDETINNKHVVWFSADGGTLNGEEALYTNNAGIVKGTIPTAEKEDSSFRGWAIKVGADESAVINFSTYKFDKDTTVHAVYKAYEVVTISYNYGDGFGTSGSAQTVNGRLASLPTPTPPTGQTFKGWYTAATGGTEVTTDTVFTQNSTIYAQYSAKNADEYTNYCLVGDTKYELEENVVSGADAAYFVCVDLSEGDTVSFYVGGQLISASVGDVWIGMVPSVGMKDVFTAERGGTFEFNITLSGTTPKWTVTGDDGTILAIEGDYYLVGKDFGNWAQCLEEYHLGTTTGSFDLTVGAKPVVFKVVRASDRLGTINWGSALGADNVTVGAGYLSIDHETDGSANTNIRLETAGTYTISLVGGEIEITSDNVTEPEAIAVKGDYYIVGLGAEFGNWAQCLEKWHLDKVTDNEVTTYEIELTVGATPATFKVVKCGNAYTGAVNWDGALGAPDVTEGSDYVYPDKDKNIVFYSAGTYVIKIVKGKVEITSEDAEPGVGPAMVPVQAGKQDGTHYNVYLIKNGDKTQGYFVKYEKVENGYDQYTISIALSEGDKVAIYVPDLDLVCTTIENSDITDTAAVNNGSIEIKSTQVYTFYCKIKSANDNKIWLAW